MLWLHIRRRCHKNNENTFISGHKPSYQSTKSPTSQKQEPQEGSSMRGRFGHPIGEQSRPNAMEHKYGPADMRSFDA